MSIRGASPCPSHDEAAKLNTDSLLKKGEKKLDEETKQVYILFNNHLTDLKALKQQTKRVNT